MKLPDDAGGRERNPYEPATPTARAPAATRPPLLLALKMATGLAAWNIVSLVRHGQTVGMRVGGVRIARPDGAEAGFGRIVPTRSLRRAHVQRVGGMATPLLGLGFALTHAAMHRRGHRRCRHDIVAGTLVVEAT